MKLIRFFTETTNELSRLLLPVVVSSSSSYTTNHMSMRQMASSVLVLYRHLLDPSCKVKTSVVSERTLRDPHRTLTNFSRTPQNTNRTMTDRNSTLTNFNWTPKQTYIKIFQLIFHKISSSPYRPHREPTHKPPKSCTVAAVWFTSSCCQRSVFLPVCVFNLK